MRVKWISGEASGLDKMPGILHGLAMQPSPARPGATRLLLRVTPPPTVNHTHVYSRGRVFRSENYQRWITTNRMLVGNVPPVCGQVRVRVEIFGGSGWRKNRDLDNALKAIMDFLQHCGVIADDGCETVTDVGICFIRSHLTGKKAPVGFATVEVTRIENP